MTIEQFSAIVAVLSAIVSAIYAHKAHRSNVESGEHARRANDIAIGQAENDLRRDITQARNRFEDACVSAETIARGRRPDQLTPEEQASLRPVMLRQRSATEDYLNAYENACSKYLDDKIDRVRFEKSYASEIRNLFEPHTNPFGTFLHPEGVSRFKALWKVYRQWNDLENRPTPSP